MKKTIFVLALLMLLLTLLLGLTAGNDNENKVEPGVLQVLEQQDEVSVIVLLRNQPILEGDSLHLVAEEREEGKNGEKGAARQVRETVLESLTLKEDENAPEVNAQEQPPEEYDLELGREYSLVNGFSGVVTEPGLEKLADHPLVEKIYLDKILHPTLDVSVPQINANEAWNLSVAGYNITGVNEAVCIIDTGIDTDHPAFQDKIVNQYCYCSVSNGCCAGSTSEASTAEDDHGHGTHVAGIALGNLSSHPGVARGAQAVAIKVCNNESSASCSSADVISGINWCANNATKFNISVISLSLGDGTAHNSYCNDDSMAATINAAVGKNVSIVISAGNNGHTTGISAPACIQNATPVGGVNDNDAVQYNRGTILELLAPGSSITAPYFGGGTTTLSGTSMSAPHVAGAIALFRQYWRLAYNELPAPDVIENKLALTGAEVNDAAGSGKIFSRVDISKALQPYLNYTTTSTINNSYQSSTSALINVSSDVNLSTALLEWSYGNGTRQNLTMTKNNGLSFYLTITNLAAGTDTYKIFGNDSVNTLGISSTRTITLDTQAPAVTITAPGSGSNFSSGTASASFTATIQEQSIDAVRFSFSNATGRAFNSTPTNSSGSWSNTVEISTLAEGSQTMTVLANDSAGNYNRSQSLEFTVDRSAPTITINSLLPERNFTRTAGNQTFNLTVRDATLAVQSVILSFTNGTSNAAGTKFNVTAENQSGYWVASYNISSLAEGTQVVTILANDTVSNYNRSETISFTVDATPPRVTFNAPAASQRFTFQSSNQTFNVTVRDALLPITSVLLSFDNSSGVGFNVSAENQSGYWIVNYNVSTLSNGDHTLAIIANDSVGNSNATEVLAFSVDIVTPIVTLNKPNHHANFSTSAIAFNCSQTDEQELYNVTLYGDWSGSWKANATQKINGTSNETLFTEPLPDGTFLWNCLVSDAASNNAFASANFTLTVDTTAPVASSIDGGAPTSTATTLSWNTNERANSTLQYGTTTSFGSISTNISFLTSHSVSLTGLTALTQYFYNVTSCDALGNCLTNGTYNFSTAAAAASSDSGTAGAGGAAGGAGGGGGGGGGGAGTATTTSAESSSGTDTPAESGSGQETGEDSSVQALAGTALANQVTFLQAFTLTKGETSVMSIDQSTIALREIKIKSKASKEALFTFTLHQKRPEQVPELPNVYQYFEITVDLTPDEISRARATFALPESWLRENNFHEETVKLVTLENGKWGELPTKFIGRGKREEGKEEGGEKNGEERGDKADGNENGESEREEGQFLYEAKLKHFSYFAITGQSELESTWMKKLIPPELGTKEFVLFGLIALIAVLLFLYYLLHREE